MQRRRGLPSAPSSAPAGFLSGAGDIAGASAGPGAGAITGSGVVAGAGAALAASSGSLSGTGTLSAASSASFPLSVHASGRYLVRADGTPFLVCADSTWSVFVDIPLSGVSSYFSTLVSQGFNSLMGNAIEHHFTIVKPPKERGSLLPFTQRMDGTTFTGSPNGTTNTNGTQGQFAADAYTSISTQAPDCTFVNNSYWLVVEQILDAAASNGLAMFVWPGYLGFNNTDEGWINEMVLWDSVIGAGGFTGQSFADNTKSKMWNYGAWLAARWKNYPHIVWMMGGDYGSGSHPLTTAQRAAVVSLVAGMKSVAGQQSLLWSAHWDRPCISDDTTISGITWDINFCYADEAVSELCRRGYSTAAKPSILGEYNYENSIFGGSAPWRKYLWWAFLGGIAGGFYGNEQLWRFDNGTPGTNYTTLLATQARLDAVRQFSLLKSFPWHRMKPNGLGGQTTLITAGGGTASPQSTDYVAAAATLEGDLLLAYVPPAHTGSITVAMTVMAGTCRARWFDPTNSSFTSIGVFPNTGTRAFTPPANNNAGDTDFLLVLEASAGALTGAGDMSGTARALAAGAGGLSGAGAIAAAGQSTAPSAGTIAGSGAIAGVGSAAIQGSSAMSGSGALAGVGQGLVAAVGALSGSGSLAAAGQELAAGVGALSGSGALAATSQSAAASVGGLAGSGDVAAQGSSPAPVVSSISGSGTIAGAGGGATSNQGSGSLSGSGTIVGASQETSASAGSLTGSGSALGASAALAAAAASLVGSGTIAGAGIVPVGFIAGSGTIAGAGSAPIQGTGGLSGAGDLQGASPAQVVPAVQTTMPATPVQSGVRQTLSRFSANISFDDLTGKYLLENYLTGFNFAGWDKQPLPPRWYEDKIANAIAKIESIIGIDILQRERSGERHDYNVDDYLNYAFLKLFFQPVLSVQQVRAVYPTGQVIQVFPADWVRLMPESGQIHLVPTSGSLAQVMLGGGNGYLPFIFAGLSHLPQLWEVDYVSGFPVDGLPRAVASAICKLASIEILTIMSDLVGPLGVASSSLGIDGMSQSIARQLPAFKARIDQYRVDLGIPGPSLAVDPKYGTGEIGQLRRDYMGIVLGSV